MKRPFQMHNKALIVIDVQQDFCPNGALAVAGGDQVVAPINSLIAASGHVILTQDWHPEGHSSFASQHEGRTVMEQMDFDYGPQTLWPDHCVQGSSGAEFHPDLNWTSAELVLRKGFRPHIDSYSAFMENDQQTSTGLAGYLRERGITDLMMVGLATDFCVGFSALDAARLGFQCTVDLSACRAIDVAGSLDTALAQMQDAGVTLIGA